MSPRSEKQFARLFWTFFCIIVHICYAHLERGTAKQQKVGKEVKTIPPGPTFPSKTKMDPRIYDSSQTSLLCSNAVLVYVYIQYTRQMAAAYAFANKLNCLNSECFTESVKIGNSAVPYSSPHNRHCWHVGGTSRQTGNSNIYTTINFTRLSVSEWRNWASYWLVVMVARKADLNWKP